METSAGERSVAVAGTYHSVDKVLEDGTNLRQGIAQVLMAPGKGIQQMVEVLAFVFIIGGVFQIMAKTNALNMGIQKIVKKLGAKEILIIPILMVLFGLGGSTFGMSDELIPFYLIIVASFTDETYLIRNGYPIFRSCKVYQLQRISYV